MKTFPGLLALFLLSLAPIGKFAPSTVPSPRNWLQTEGEFAKQRRDMVEEQIAERGIKDSAALRVMETVLRHEFVPESHWKRPYS
jgi:hypothetical protein